MYFTFLENSFLPRYLNIILKKKYEDKIAEVRIEGHTSAEGEYIYNLQLSQERTRNVLDFLLHLNYFDNPGESERRRLQYWLTANGLSFGKQLDKSGNEDLKTSQVADSISCRRVEFRILTTSDDLIKKAVDKLSN